MTAFCGRRGLLGQVQGWNVDVPGTSDWADARNENNVTMKQYILRKIYFSLICAWPLVGVSAAPAVCSHMAEPDFPQMSGMLLEEAGEPSLEVEGATVQILNAQGQTLEVYDITGKRVMLVRVDSNDKKVNLNLRKGCYIVKVGKLTRKVAVS